MPKPGKKSSRMAHSLKKVLRRSGTELVKCKKSKRKQLSRKEQEMRERHPDWIVKKPFDFDRVCSRAYAEEYLAVSQCAALGLHCAPVPVVVAAQFGFRFSAVASPLPQPLGGCE